MAQGVVDLLELVQVHEEQGDPLALGVGRRHLGPDHVVELAAVREPGERVVEGLAPQGLGGLRDLGGVLEGDGHQPSGEGEGVDHGPAIVVAALTDGHVVEAERPPLGAHVDQAGGQVPRREGGHELADRAAADLAAVDLEHLQGGRVGEHGDEVGCPVALVDPGHQQRQADVLDDVGVLP